MTESDSLAPQLDLRDFTLGQMLRCGLDIRKITRQAATLEEAAGSIVRHLFEATRSEREAYAACPLVRFYKTHPLMDLPPEVRRIAEASAGGEAAPATPCLTLIASAGVEPGWNDRRQSRGHQAIPLVSEESIERAPMISRLLEEFGVSLTSFLSMPSSDPARRDGKTYDVFYVPEADGSPYIPAQDFVREYGVRSVIGFGGVLKSGEMFAVILFSRTPVPAESAQRFKTIALDVRSALFGFGNEAVFEGEPGMEQAPE
jgi:hypothetical protein